MHKIGIKTSIEFSKTHNYFDTIPRTSKIMALYELMNVATRKQSFSGFPLIPQVRNFILPAILGDL